MTLSGNPPQSLHVVYVRQCVNVWACVGVLEGGGVEGAGRMSAQEALI
jgi:hypothetical protein